MRAPSRCRSGWCRSTGGTCSATTSASTWRRWPRNAGSPSATAAGTRWTRAICAPRARPSTGSSTVTTSCGARPPRSRAGGTSGTGACATSCSRTPPMTDGPPVPPKPATRTTKAAPRKAAPKAAKPAAEVTQVAPEDPPATNGGQEQQQQAEQQFERFEPWKPTGASWREDALARIAELESLAIVLRRHSTQDARSADDLLMVAREHLKVARTAAEDRPGALRGSSGANVTRVVSNIHVAETALLRLAPDDYVLGQIPTIHAYVVENLGPKDTRRTQLKELTSVDHPPLTETQRVMLVAAVREANSEARKKVSRVRSFRNVLLMTAG